MTTPTKRHPELRAALRDVFKRFTDEYFRRVDEARGYPEEFVDGPTGAGWLAVMIPEEFGGAGLGLAEASVVMEEVNRCGGNAGACHGQIYNMGTLLVNAAASHVVEQDDVHNGSVFHPAAVVFPAAQATGASGREFLAAAVAGYEVGIRVGEFLSRSHYRNFHTTATAGTIAAAAAAGHLLGLGATAMLHAFGSAGTQAAGLWEFLRDAADSKQLHCAHAASAGLASAYLARDGFTGARRILEGE